jgi:hypothetical protein
MELALPLPRRCPRAVYRVYSEEEYLAGADPFPEWEPSSLGTGANTNVRAVPIGSGEARVRSDPNEARHGLRLRRLLVGAALAGVAGAVGAAIGLAGLARHSEPGAEIAKQLVLSPVSRSEQVASAGNVQPVVSDTSISTPSATRASRSAQAARAAALSRPAPPRPRARSGLSSPVQGHAPTRLVQASQPASRPVQASQPPPVSQPASTPAPAPASASAPASTPTSSAPASSPTPASAQSPVASTTQPQTQSAPAQTSPRQDAQNEFGFER